MLSRVAENNYWLGRYLDRVESTARIISAQTILLMDLPSAESVGWHSLIRITGMQERYALSKLKYSESNVVRFLIADQRNPASIINSLNFARENARTLRDALPREAWLSLNELYHSVNDNLPQTISTRTRFEMLRSITRQSATFSGIIQNAMSHSMAYHFLNMGMLIERADMTSRSIESLPRDLAGKKSDHYASYDNVRLMSMLKSLSAYQMYWQQVRSQISSDKAVKFLWSNPQFPRSVNFCVERIEMHLRELPDNKKLLVEIDKIKTFIQRKNHNGLTPSQLHKTMDLLQIRLGKIHNSINLHYFNY